MDDDIPTTPDDEREVPLEDEAEFDPPPPTLDPEERIEAEDEPDETLDEFGGGFEG